MPQRFIKRVPCAMVLKQTEVSGLRKGVAGLRVGLIADYVQ
jgi:hypothetical protein